MSVTKIRNIFNYGISALNNRNEKLSETEVSLNRILKGYPRNHNYEIRNKKLCPGFRLYERLKRITGLYPDIFRSFLDIGCCRGFFVMDAVERHHCCRAVGIDVHRPFVSISEKVRKHMDIGNAAFYLATLDEMSANPENYGGPFQTVLLLGAYHYLFWGSRLCPKAYYSHEKIFRRLASVCSERLIISGRFEVNRLTEDLKEMAGKDIIYDTESFLDAAGSFFNVYQSGYLAKNPLFVMIKKKTG